MSCGVFKKEGKPECFTRQGWIEAPKGKVQLKFADTNYLPGEDRGVLLHDTLGFPRESRPALNRIIGGVLSAVQDASCVPATELSPAETYGYDVKKTASYLLGYGACREHPGYTSTVDPDALIAAMRVNLAPAIREIIPLLSPKDRARISAIAEKIPQMEKPAEPFKGHLSIPEHTKIPESASFLNDESQALLEAFEPGAAEATDKMLNVLVSGIAARSMLSYPSLCTDALGVGHWPNKGKLRYSTLNPYDLIPMVRQMLGSAPIGIMLGLPDEAQHRILNLHRRESAQSVSGTPRSR